MMIMTMLRMRTNRTVILLMVVVVVVLMCQIGSSRLYVIQTLYNSNDDIEMLNQTSFNSVVFDSDRATFVENYAHWCGACQRFARHWREIAKETKLWHKKVLRIAAINCGDSFNDAVCADQNIKHYPTLKLFHAHSRFDSRDHGGLVVQADKTEALIEQVINFLEQHPNKPKSWPDLVPFGLQKYEQIFAGSSNNPEAAVKYALLIFEKESSYLGRKLILDFSSYTDQIIIRRVTESTNPYLFSRLYIKGKQLPLIYLVDNTKKSSNGGEIELEKFDVELLKRYVNENDLNRPDYDTDQEEEEENDSDELKHHDDGSNKEFIEKLRHMSERHKYASMIRKFIKYNNLLSHDEFRKLKEHANAGKNHAIQVKIEDTQLYLANMTERVHMEDLESSLSVMFRSEIKHHELISGDALNALKEWLRVLSKYFPGRKPVKSYLKRIYANSFRFEEISRRDWANLININEPETFLPNKTEWIHCKGHNQNSAGYPCSLWTLFHVLTVSQMEIELSRVHPFEDGFNVLEIVEAIVNFVRHFFSCEECVENFAKETSDYVRYLIKPNDAILYLWKVHNRVNYRLANDPLFEQDPMRPKKLFPSDRQCPKCYLKTIDINRLAEHESLWSLNDVILFIRAFYSKYQILPVGTLPLPAKPIKQQKSTTKKATATTTKPSTTTTTSTATTTTTMIVEDAANIDKRAEKIREQEKIMDEHIRLADSGAPHTGGEDFKLGFVIFLVVLSAFGFMFIYFGFVKPKSNFKQKKHII